LKTVDIYALSILLTPLYRDGNVLLFH